MNWNYELFIDGAWTSEGASGSIEVVDPATEEVIGSVPEASTKTAVRAIEAARRAFDEGPWPYMKPAERAARLVAMAEILEGSGGGSPRADRRRDRIDGVLHRRRPRGGFDRDAAVERGTGRALLPLGRERHADRRPDGIGRQCHRARADRRGGGHHAVQLSLHAEHRQGGPGPGCRLHGGPQAAPVDATRRHDDRRGRGGGGHSAGRAQRDHGARRGGRRADVEPNGRHGHLHRFDGHRAPHHGVRRRDGEEGPTRARRQERHGGAR